MFTAMGSLHGENVKIRLTDANLDVDVRSETGTCLGALYGNTTILTNHVGLTLENAGQKTLIFGGLQDKGRMEIWDADTKVVNHSSLNVDTVMADDRIRLVNGKCRIFVNDREVKRELRFETS